MASGLYSLAGKLVGELCSPLFQDYVGKPWGLGKKKEFEKLERTLSTLKAVLLDAEDRQETNHQIQDWLTKIKLVFYDVEDLLLEVTTEALKRQVMTKKKRAKEVRIFFSSSNQLRYRFNMGSKVKLIRESLDAIASDRNNFNLAERHEEMHVGTRFKRRDETHSFVPIDKFIGRDKDKRVVTSLLLESDCVDNVSVISIIGIGGLGKTTLAQSIYSSEEVKGNFELMMWVCVSDPFDVKLICEKIIESATKKKYERLQMDIVKDELKKAVDGKKYLLVLDDVWNECPEKWLNLEVLLSAGAQGSKILITTRAELVARTSKSMATHVLKGLSPEESWTMFKQLAFKRGVEPRSSTIVGIGKEVAERCVGVPLAIKTTGSLLGRKERENEWLDFKKNVLPLITQDSESNIVQILKSSYDYLSSRLKRCFAYCAIFPKDWPIGKDDLIRMWMAQGLIQLDGTTRSLEDVGEQHFMDLMDRSLFEEVHEIDDHGTIRWCKMHDLIHDLALSVGGKEFWSSGSYVNCIDVRTRHAWASYPGPFISTNLSPAKKLRTLVIKNSFATPKNDLNVGDFKQMRVLDFTYLNICGDPGVYGFRVYNCLDGLRFLNYLDLSGNILEILPESICSLYNLQTLILNECFNLKKLPTGTRNLVSLRHLEFMGCYKLGHMPRGLGELICLRTLSEFVIGPKGTNCSKLGELKRLVNLRGKLIIRRLRGAKVATSSGGICNPTPLAELQFIQGLVLEWRNVDEIDKNEQEEADELESLKPHPNLEGLSLRSYGGRRFPRWMERANIRDSLPNIRSICLSRCKGWRHLPPLGLLPCLRELELLDMGDIEFLYDDGWNNNNSWYFPTLEKLRIWNCPLLVADGWKFLGLDSLHELCFSKMETLPGWLPSLPLLQTLKISFCNNIVTLPEWVGNLTSLQEVYLQKCDSLVLIPDCVQHLTTLQRLDVRGCQELYRRYNKDSGEDWYKIAHIPNVTLKKEF